jgi:hypothetical protein
MAFVILRTDQGGGYIAKPGSISSYTKNLANAQTFLTAESAQANCCPENERVIERFPG